MILVQAFCTTFENFDVLLSETALRSFTTPTGIIISYFQNLICVSFNLITAFVSVRCDFI
jgi:hypothetical protein